MIISPHLRRSRLVLLSCAGALMLSVGSQQPASASEPNIKREYATTLRVLSAAMLQQQICEPGSPGDGAIQCAHCSVLHTRAAEIVFPFAQVFAITGDSAYLRAAIRVGNWLIRQQQPDGSWKETPEEWTGTSTDQLLMMVLAFQKLKSHLTDGERQAWLLSIERAADYLERVMSPEFASINYVATTAASLAATFRLLPKDSYSVKAAELAHRTVAKMDADGFINGEGGRNHTSKSGVDLGYEMEMSLWGLGYYARLTGDKAVHDAVKRSLALHLYFIYPDGSMDNSWGIRSNKWTGYGGATSDGCQVLFSLFADEDSRCASAGLKNLQFLRSCMKDGLVGYGPLHWQVFKTPPCIYPTFTKAKNLAMAYDLETGIARPQVPFPAQKQNWMRVFRTLNVVQVRTDEIMATVTAYGYKDQRGGAKSKYMHRPTGGAASNLWVQGHGYLQASSVTAYSRPEPMSFPEAPGIRSLSSRIEYSDSLGYFSNLYEFDGRLETEQKPGKPREFTVRTAGELKDKNWLEGGIGYLLEHRFRGRVITRRVRLTYHDAFRTVTIVEPIIDYPGMSYTCVDPRTVLIKAGKRSFEFKLVSGIAKLRLGENRESYWTPYPALKAFPIELEVAPPPHGYTQEIVYTLKIING